MKWKTYSDDKWVDSIVGEYAHKDVKWMIEKIEQQQQEIERLKDENNKLKDFIQENDVDRLENASDVIGEAMLEFFGEAIEDHKEAKEDFIKKKKENQESRDRILKSIEDQKQRFESRRGKFAKHFENIR